MRAAVIARARGATTHDRLAATLCWGAHRDTAAIRAMGAKVWNLGTCPNRPLELRPRADDALTHARFGAVAAGSGDIVFADDDGVVFVGLTHLAEVIETARDIAVREGAQAARLLKGDLLRSQLDLKGTARSEPRIPHIRSETT